MTSRIRSARTIAAALAAIAVSLPSLAIGQSIWMPRDRDRSVMLEVLKPSLEFADEDALSAAFFLGARVPLNPNVALVGELPYARLSGHVDYGFLSFEADDAAIGNPYLGVELGRAAPFFVELGVRAPVFEPELGVALVGSVADASRFDAFLGDAVNLHAAINLRQVGSSGIVSRLRVGATVAIPTDDEAFGGLFFGYDETELFAVYAWQIGYEGRCLRLGSAVSGWLHVTEDTGNLGTRTMNQIEIHSDFGSWRLRPGLELKLPLGNEAFSTPIVLGVSLSAAL